MNRPRTWVNRAAPLLLAAAAVFALRSATAGEPPARPGWLRHVAAADLGQESWSREQAAGWAALAAPALTAATDGASGRYGEGWVERAWFAPPQAGVPAGATVLDGQFVDAPQVEAERQDVRVLTLGAGDGAQVAVTLPPNAGSPQVTFTTGGSDGELLVVVRGRAWRAGTYLEIYRWHLAEARVERLYTVSGEDWTTAALCASIEGGPAPRALVYGLAEEGQPRPQPLAVSLAPTPRASFNGGGPAAPSPPAGR